jgi:hypothetical protein
MNMLHLLTSVQIFIALITNQAYIVERLVQAELDKVRGEAEPVRGMSNRGYTK